MTRVSTILAAVTLVAGSALAAPALATGYGVGMYFAGADGKVLLWDLRRDDPAEGAVVLRSAGDEVTCLTISHDERHLAAASADAAGAKPFVQMWRLAVEDLLALAEEAAGRTLSEDDLRRYDIPLVGRAAGALAR